MQLVEGKKIQAQILAKLTKKNKAIKGTKPALAVLIVGNDKPSHTYVKMKGRVAKQIGIDFLKFDYPSSIKKEDLITEIQKIQKKHKLSGMILQLPLPGKLRKHTREIANYINPNIDVDCLSHVALGRVMMGESPLTPPTPGAIMEILKYYKIDLRGKEVCLIGRGDLIGKPLAAMLAFEPVIITTCDHNTPDISVYTKKADIIITGVGKKDLIIGKMIKKGAIVIDAGVSFENGKIYGDAHVESISKKASLLTPTPGGVGPITIAKLLENTMLAHNI